VVEKTPLPFGSIDLEAVKDAPAPVQQIVENLDHVTKEERRDRQLVKSGGRVRCLQCKGQWDTKAQAMDHFGCEAP